MGYGKTRFASPDNSFKTLYIALDLATGIAEAIIRDRFEKRLRRRLNQTEIETWGATEVLALRPLDLVDIRANGLFLLGVSTNAKGAKSQTQGRRFSQAVHDQSAADGILYISRLTGKACCAVYERAVGKLDASAVEDLVSLAGLIPALRRLKVALVAKA